MLKELYRLSRYRDGPIVLEGGQVSLTPSADSNIDDLLKHVDEGEHGGFGGPIDVEFGWRVDVKRKLVDLQGSVIEFWIKKRRVPRNVAEAVELVQELLQSNTNVNAVPLSDAP